MHLREDFLLEFDGFHGSPSRCHVKIVSDPGKPLVVMCSQVLTKPGTSIMNGYEIIRERVYAFLSKKCREQQKTKTAQGLDDFSQALETTKKIHIALLIYILKLTSSALRNNSSILSVILRNTPEVIWLEHWPEGTAPRHMRHLLVSENEVGRPTWQHISIESFSEGIGYTPQDFSIDNESVA